MTRKINFHMTYEGTDSVSDGELAGAATAGLSAVVNGTNLSEDLAALRPGQSAQAKLGSWKVVAVQLTK